MHKHKRIARFVVALTALCVTNATLAQNFLEKTQFSLKGEGLTSEKVVKAFETTPRTFTPNEIITLKENVKQYNADIDRQVQNNLENRQKLVDVRQRLLQQKDNAKLTVQLAEAEKSYDQILADIKKQLEGIAYKGFYVCAIKNIDPFADPEKLIDQAQKAITPTAVQDILGFFIESVTEMYRSDKFDERIYKHIREEISGKLKVEEKFKHEVNPAERVFWYACKVTVTPLQEKVATHNVASSFGNPDIIIANILKTPDITSLLVQKGITTTTAADVAVTVEANRMSVMAENQSIKTRERNIIRSGQQKLDEMTDKIAALKRRIEQLHTDLKQLIESNTTLKYSASNIQASIDAADKALLARIKTLFDEELSLQERKLQTEWDRPIATAGDPKVTIAQNVVELKTQFETNYGQLVLFIEINEMVNDNYSKSQGKKVIYQRNVDNVWVFVEALPKGFNMHVVARLRITGSPTTTPPSSGFQSFTERVAATTIDMVAIKGGTFKMGDTFGDGDSDEKPVHSVTVSDFYIGKYVVTQAQWRAVMGNNPSHSNRGIGDNNPVNMVSWNDIQEFLRKLNQMTGKTYRLPTEAEWEHAAKGGTLSRGYKYSGSNTIDEVAWYSDNSGSKTHPVGSKKPNELGLYDMSGNVWEWCNDWYGGYTSSAKTNPTGPATGSSRVIRGGSWSFRARFCRSASRGGNPPVNRYINLGFRLVCVP